MWRSRCSTRSGRQSKRSWRCLPDDSTAGLTFRNDIVSGPGGQQILLEDPAGNPIELFLLTKMAKTGELAKAERGYKLAQ